MKILQINKYHYFKGGAETIFFNTIKLLEENGHEVFRFCLKSNKNLPYKDDSYFVDYPEMSEVGFFKKIKHFFSFFYNRDSKRKIEQLILDKKPDVAHIHLLFNGISVSILPVLKKHNIPVIMTAHDHRLICPAYAFLDGNNKPCDRCINGNYLNCAIHKCHNRSFFSSLMLAFDMYFRNWFFPVPKYLNRLITVSKFSYQKHITYNDKYKKPGCVLYNPVDKSFFTERIIPDFTKEKYYFYYGRISREKGIATLIEVAKTLNIKLKIAGTGPLLDQFKMNAFENIEFLGFKSGKELRDLIMNAYFVIVPSECRETFGLTVAEPQAMGVPVIGSRMGAIPELIEDGKNGFLFETQNLNDLICTIKKADEIDSKQYLEMVSSSQKNGLKYTPELYYENLMTIYSNALNSD